MEPTTLALAGIVVLMVKKSAETVSEVVTKDVLEAMLPTLRTVAAQLASPVRDRVAAFGDRVAARLPAANLENPFDDLALLEAIVVEEAADPVVAATVNEVAASLPAINIKIDQRRQQGNVFNDQSAPVFNAPITQHFS
jgi:hypothetical protein